MAVERHPADIDGPQLVADIGGTHARFAWVPHAGAAPLHAQSLAVAGFGGPAEAASAYLHALAQQLGAAFRAPGRAAFAVATAVAGDRVAFTNSPWAFSCSAVRQQLGLSELRVLNDFEALALSLPALQDAQLQPHPSPPRPRRHDLGAVLAVVGPGTGLGVGAVMRVPTGWQALPGEGGHATLAAGDALEAEVIAVARRQHAHVSAERLLSGTGLPLLHAALAQAQGRPDGGLAGAADIVQAAERGDDQAARTLDLFCALLGAFCGNVVLTLGARGGLYIGGGIVPRIAPRFAASDFRARFEAKGRFRGYLAAVPSALITDTQAALHGAAQALAGH